MQTGMAFGKFVLLHSGHVRFLARAKSLVDRLVVVVASDGSVRKERGGCLVPAEQRREVVSALRSVDEAIIGDAKDRYAVVRKRRPDVIILGPDQEVDESRLAYDLQCLGLRPKVVRISDLSDGELHKTSRIIGKILSG